MMPRFLQDPDILDTIGIGIQLCVYLICIPLIISSLLVLLYQYKNNEIVEDITSERELPYILFLNVLCIFELLINRPVNLSTTVWFAISDEYIPCWSVILIYSIFWIAILMLYALRCWKLYYKQQLNIAYASKLWQSKINCKKAENWFILKQHKYTNNYHLFKLLFPIYLLFICIAPILQILPFNKLYIHIFNGSFASIPLFIALLIFCKSNKVIDRFGIRNEFKFQNIVLLIFLIIYFIQFTIFTFTDHGKNNTYFLRIESLNYSINAVFVNCSLALTSTLYPLFICSQNNKKQPPHRNHNYSPVEHTSYDVIVTESSENPNIETNYPLIEIIGDKMGFRLFMNYLISEFATESLLFITELVQCKYIYNGILNRKESINSLFSNACATQFNNEINIRLPFGLVMTDILSSSDGTFREQPIYNAMKELYNKYVMINAMYPINISGEMRNKLYSVFEKECTCCNKELLTVFDDVALDILWTLHDASHRFQSTETFNRYHTKHRSTEITQCRLSHSEMLL